MHLALSHRKMVLMGRVVALVAVVLGAVSLSGCGAPSLANATAPTPADAPASPMSEATRTHSSTLGPTARTMGPTFPLTVRRVGGIAEFHDTVVLQVNGSLTVDTDQFTGRTCTLDKTDRTALVGALSTLQLADPGTGTPQPNDTNSNPIRLTVTDAHDRAVDLGDPSLGDIRSSLSALVSDVTLTSPTSTKCTTPTPAGTP